ncbi:MAG: hypothetical protein H7840_16225, partial [Alphaproteobacteria bacterium]
MGHLDTSGTRLKDACRLILDQKGLGGNVFGPEAPLEDIRRVCQTLSELPIAIANRLVFERLQKESLEFRDRLPLIADTDDPGWKYCSFFDRVLVELSRVLVALGDGKPTEAPTPLPSTWGEQCDRVRGDIAALKEDVSSLPEPPRERILKVLEDIEKLLLPGSALKVGVALVTQGIRENLNKYSDLFNHPDVQKAITSAGFAAVSLAANSPAVTIAAAAAGQLVGPRLWSLVGKVWTGGTGLLASANAPLPERKEPTFTVDQEGTSNKPSPPPSGGRGLGEGGAEALDRVPPA